MKPTFEEFVETVRQLRVAQRDYFRTRAPADLEKARYLERKIDRWVETLQTAELFEQGGEG